MLFCEFCGISKNTFFTKHLWENAFTDTYLTRPEYASSGANLRQTAISNVTGTFGSSHRTCSVKKGALKNFAKFTGGKKIHKNIYLKYGSTSS